MDLSVIIVNYNVKYFLEQCIHSVKKSIGALKTEIIVVDNNSVDGSCQMLKEKFPELVRIENRSNAGFAKANNQGITVACGKYILILNPDTVLQEDTLHKCFEFMESHPEAGSMGVKMIDGKGRFLPESKRSLPTPQVAFCKIFGLSALFPRSEVFSKYHLGYLDENKIHQVDILSGAFMFIRHTVIKKIGLLDEEFFMYGEDIDYSYRILLAGYRNYYYPETTIIHYKGESTKKGSINYVRTFYKAMIIFAKKHFSAKHAQIVSILINTAVYIRASVSICRRIFLQFIIPVFDALLIYTGFFILKPVWEKLKFGIEGYYPDEFMQLVVPIYLIFWIFSLYITGGYEKRVRLFDLLRGIGLGSLLLLIMYALLPEQLRYSRALIVLGMIWASLTVFISRLTLGIVFNTTQLYLSNRKKRIIIAGSHREAKRVLSILNQARIEPVLVGLVDIKESSKSEEFVGNLSQIDDIVKINRVDEIVFCSKEIPSQTIIQTMLTVTDPSVEFKIAPPESLSIIGSNSINTSGELYGVHLNSLTQNLIKRRKRIFDILVSFLVIGTIPFTFLWIEKPLRAFGNAFSVLISLKTWVGLYKITDNDPVSLPQLSNSVLTPVPFKQKKDLKMETIQRLNLLYAKDYRIMNDLSIILRDFRYLGK